jgi:hypothetical protein
MTSQRGEMQIVFAVCPGERLHRIELVRLAPDRDAAGTLLWAVAGDAAVPSALAIGADVAGLDTEVFLREPLQATDPLALDVTTSELDHTPLEFIPKDVPSTGVLSFDVRHGSVEDFRAYALRQTPCDDPDHKKVPGQIVDWLFVIQATAALIGAGLLASLPRYPPPSNAERWVPPHRLR